MILTAILTGLKYAGPVAIVALIILAARKFGGSEENKGSAQQTLTDASSQSSIKAAEDAADKGDVSGLENLP